MERGLSVAKLGGPDIDPAFALIQALYPDLALDDWRTFAGLLTRRPSPRQCGMVGVRNEAGYLCGLFTYHVEPSLRCGHALVVDVLAALDVMDVKAVMRMILDTILSTASRQQCGIAYVRLGSEQEAFARFLVEGGLQLEGQLLSTRISI